MEHTGKRYPLKLSYITKNAIWAGKRLKTDFGKVCAADTISEAWELCVRESDKSLIICGEASGLTLAEYFEKYGYDCVSPRFTAADRFPLLIKLIDAGDALSVQVHPDDDYARDVENDSGKTELWYVVDAAEGAQIVYGLSDGVDRDGLARAVAEGRVGDVVRSVSVRAGEAYFIPAGMIHALGAGILVAEIQQNADLTYRVYDFDRVGADGLPRELHVEKALAVARAFSDEEIEQRRYSKGREDGIGELLASSEHFSVRKLEVDGCARLSVTEESFASLLCIDGRGSILQGGEAYPIRKGDSYFLPAGMGEYELHGDVTVIISRCRDNSKNGTL